jgi:hypothetical protein
VIARKPGARHQEQDSKHGRSMIATRQRANVVVGPKHCAIEPPRRFWSEQYDTPINFVGHIEKWDNIAIEGDMRPRSLPNDQRGGRIVAVASIFRDLASPETKARTKAQANTRDQNCSRPTAVFW